MVLVDAATGKFAAVAINGIIEAGAAKIIDEKQMIDRQLKLAKEFAAWRNAKVNLFEKFHVTRIFDLKKLSVDRR